MLSPRSLAAITLLLSACGGNKLCDIRFERDVDWHDAPGPIGFSANDFADAFAREWRAEVHESRFSYPIASLQTMEQGWTWTWRPDRDEDEIMHRKLKKRTNHCPSVRWDAQQHTLTIPAIFEGWSDDEVWAYRGKGWVVTWELPQGDFVPQGYWTTSFEPDERHIFLHRTHPDFMDEAKAVLGVEEIPAVMISNWDRYISYGLDLMVYDPMGEYQQSRVIGGGPFMALTEPIR